MASVEKRAQSPVSESATCAHFTRAENSVSDALERIRPNFHDGQCASGELESDLLNSIFCSAGFFGWTLKCVKGLLSSAS